MQKFFQLFVFDKKNPSKYYRNMFFLLLIVVALYFLFALGDMLIKGNTDLTFTPIGLLLFAAGIMLGLYYKNKK